MQSQNSPYLEFARQRKSPKEVARLLGCDQRTAREGLRDAVRLLSERTDRCENAAGMLLHSALSRPAVSTRGGDRDVNRWRKWQDVALGISKAA